MSKSALVVIDIQNDYFPGGKWTLADMDAAAANAAKLIADARQHGRMIVHVRHENPSPEAPFFQPGTPGAEIHESVRPAGDETVILKNFPNSFRETNLKEILDGAGVTELVICGAMSHMCVDAGTRAAADYGYAVTVIHDACASRDLEFNGVTVPAEFAHAAFMSALGFGYASLKSTDDYLGQVRVAA